MKARTSRSAAWLAAGLIVIGAGLTGCTIETRLQPASRAAAPVTAGPSPAAVHPALVLSGKLVPLRAPTHGTVTIVNLGDTVNLTLEQFATRPGRDLLLGLRPGPLNSNDTPGAAAPAPFELVPLKAASGNQTYNISFVLPRLQEFHNLVIYDAASGDVYGSADLAEQVTVP
ncbi:DM13 domain-containing protein [Paenarthrobacter sp. DKR-5]|nr:DM13 domain-containing protein [Paenarthrobacter sp. DKR-5]